MPALQQPWAVTDDGAAWKYSLFGYIAATRHHGDRSGCAREARQLRTADEARARVLATAHTVAHDLDVPADEDDWAPHDLATLLEQLATGGAEQITPTVLEVETR